jgi:thymidine phosphorylase
MNKLEAHTALDTLQGKQIKLLEEITNLTVDLLSQKIATEKAEITTTLAVKQAEMCFSRV